VYSYFTGPCNLADDRSYAHGELRRFIKDIPMPLLVWVNSLRKIHPFDDKPTHSTQIVYSAFTGLFPDSTIAFSHHEKKDPTEGHFTEGEEFSGALSWFNDCQVALRLHVPKGTVPAHGGNLMLRQTGSQVAPPPKHHPRLKLNAEANGFIFYL